MEEHFLKIRSIEKVTHDVLGIKLDKPKDYTFNPGQATEVAINKPEWKEARRPFTFTCLPDDDFLEFNIKTYPERKGVTNELRSLKPGDELILHDVWGAISYKGEGTFIAGGAGVTPFIAIFRHLRQQGKIGNNKLIFANKTRVDIIHEKEFSDMLGRSFINILSDEETKEYAHGYISEKFLKDNAAGFDKPFYVCGPPPMMDAIQKYLTNLGVGDKSIVVEI